MTGALSWVAFAAAALLYGAASVLYFLEVARARPLPPPDSSRDSFAPPISIMPPSGSPPGRLAPTLLGLGAAGHLAYVTLASFVLRVCPVHSAHFVLSVASLLAIAVYLGARRRFRIHALGMLVGPLGLAFLLGTFFLGRPGPEPSLPPGFIALHVLANLLGLALFLLAGGAATLYLVQEKRLKAKKLAAVRPSFALPPLETLDRAVHRFLVAGFPLLTLGIVTGTFWARRLEAGTIDEITRAVFGYLTWGLIASVLMVRAAGWRGRRAAYGAIAGLGCAMAVLVTYLVRPALGG